METQVKEKLEQMKKLRKILVWASAIASVVVAVVLILFNFMPCTNLQLEGSDKFQNGFSYPGWQLIYYGIGIQYIVGYYEFGFNIWTCLGMFLPLIAMVVCYLLYNKGKNKHKAIMEFVMAGCIIFGGIMLVLCGELSINVAGTQGLVNFRDTYLYPAIAYETYTLLAYPIITFVVCLIVGLFKVFNGLFLLYQKSYGEKNIAKK